jgi:hypothetical protein
MPERKDGKPKKAPVRMSAMARAAANPGKLRFAVNGKCHECQGNDSDPCPAWRIGNCDIEDCCLWSVRPHQGMAGRAVPSTLKAMGWGR